MSDFYQLVFCTLFCINRVTCITFASGSEASFARLNVSDRLGMLMYFIVTINFSVYSMIDKGEDIAEKETENKFV